MKVKAVKAFVSAFWTFDHFESCYLLPGITCTNFIRGDEIKEVINAFDANKILKARMLKIVRSKRMY